MIHRIAVPLPDRGYEVIIGAGLLENLADHLAVPDGTKKAVVVTVGPVAAIYAERVLNGLRAAGLQAYDVVVPDGEEAKTLATLDGLFHRFAAIPLGRKDVVVALGGGVAGDLAGFAAATWNRGVPVIQMPTTLLAQVDAAIGGKTGVNLAEGKNLVGAFHQPSVVIADTSTLTTLPPRELRAGLGEVAKYGFIDDPELLELLEARPQDAVAGNADVLTEVVRRSVAVKARIVAADERESGERALLNYGHTIGHAIETFTGYGTYRHGEAVALGMVAAARLGELMGLSETGLADRTVALLNRLGLPTGGLRADPAELWTLLERDKKAHNGVRFVICRRPGDAVLVEAPERRIVDTVLRSLA